MHRRRNRKRVRHQEKVVFVLDPNSQNINTKKADETYNYVRDMVDIMLRKSGVATDVVFVGGNKNDLCIWISGVLSFYQFSQITMQDNTHLFDFDPDFDMPDNYR
jgi:arabinogalactan endo-1,4-beta-galactosidase